MLGSIGLVTGGLALWGDVGFLWGQPDSFWCRNYNLPLVFWMRIVNFENENLEANQNNAMLSVEHWI